MTVDAGSLAEACRPAHLAKTCITVAIAQYCAWRAGSTYATHAVFAFPGATGIYAGIYLLNDISDAASDRNSPTKALRAIVSGRLTASAAAIAAVALCGIGILFLRVAGTTCVIAGLLALFNQLCYSFPPLRLRDRSIHNIFSGAVVSQVSKVAIGFASLSSEWPPLLICAPLLLFKLATYIAYKNSDIHRNLFERDSRLRHIKHRPRSIPVLLTAASLISMVCMQIKWDAPFPEIAAAFGVGCGASYLMYLYSYRKTEVPTVLQTFIYSSQIDRRQGATCAEPERID